jgi:hypothetical protein
VITRIGRLKTYVRHYRGCFLVEFCNRLKEDLQWLLPVFQCPGSHQNLHEFTAKSCTNVVSILTEMSYRNSNVIRLGSFPTGCIYGQGTKIGCRVTILYINCQIHSLIWYGIQQRNQIGTLLYLLYGDYRLLELNKRSQ